MLTPTLFGIFGLFIGSFLGVVLCRMAAGEGFVSGRSACRNCKHALSWAENIPVFSFLLLRGRCGSCKERIPRQDFFMEVATGVLFFAVGLVFYGPEAASRLETVWLLFFVSILLLIAVYDFGHMEIPLSFLYAGIFGTLFYLLLDWSLFETGARLWESGFGRGLVGAAVVSGFFLALVYVSKETWMGWGDVWLGFLSGLSVGGAHAFLLLTLAFCIGSVIGVGLIWFSGKGLKTQVPFAPFLVSANLILLFVIHLFPGYTRFFFG